MSIFVPNSQEPSNNIQKFYGYYGKSESNSLLSLRLGSLNPNYGSIPADTDDTDPITSGTFAENTDRPVGLRITNNKPILNASNNTTAPDYYPGQENFGKESIFQYIYSDNPSKDRIGVF